MMMKVEGGQGESSITRWNFCWNCFHSESSRKLKNNSNNPDNSVASGRIPISMIMRSQTDNVNPFVSVQVVSNQIVLDQKNLRAIDLRNWVSVFLSSRSSSATKEYRDSCSSLRDFRAIPCSTAEIIKETKSRFPPIEPTIRSSIFISQWSTEECDEDGQQQ